jgi:membrane-bound lytic murein transglycosylase A
MIARICAGAASAKAGAVSHSVVGWDQLPGWADDDHAAALGVFQETCRDLADDWRGARAAADHADEARAFFEAHFRPVLTMDGSPPLFTGYYEPEIDGSPVRTDRFSHPIYRVPPEVVPGAVWHSRTEIETRGLLDGRGLEIAWVADAVEAFFLQVQGSGRIRFPDGRSIRVGFAGRNGHPYRSIGQELVRTGAFPAQEVSAQVIRCWVRENPEAGAALLRHNPSFVFFREVTEVPPDRGPLGTMGRSVMPMRSIAVDPAFVPLGAPVWVETTGATPIRRLMVAQDTGSAIRGPQRADVFCGTGDAAGAVAGRMRDGGRMLVLLPAAMADALARGR